ncbi:MAG: tetratricopeptide repeat protein [Anaerolineae bacterium]|nr:tetratricopeptide repeat protein [Anaerolineae bacterium]
MRKRLLEPANWIIDNEILLLIAAVSLIAVPGSYAWNSASGWPGPLVWVGLILISIPWLLRWFFNGGPTKATLLDAPLVFLLIAMGIGLGVSVCPATTLRQLLVLVAGIAIYYGLVNGLRSGTTVWLGVVVWLICGTLQGFVLLIQFAWIRSGGALTPLLQQIEWLGNIAPDASSLWLDPGITAGVLSMVVPVTAALVVAVWQTYAERHVALRWIMVSTAIELVIILVACVVLARSWGELVAIGLTALLLPCLFSRHWRLVLASLGTAVILAMALFWFIGTPFLQSLLPLRDWLRPIYPSRWEVWTRALYMIEAYPFTGIGMGVFAIIAQNNFPYFEAGLNQLPHAHNLYLQTALDGGLLAALALLGLIVAFYVGTWRSVNSKPIVAQPRDRPLRMLQIGLAGGFAVFLTAGFFDDAVLTSPVASLSLWALLGLAESARQVRPVRTPVPEWAFGNRARGAWGVAIVGVTLAVVAAAYLLPVIPLFHNNIGNICRDHGWLASNAGDNGAEWAISALDNYRRALAAGRGAGLGYRSWGDLLFRSRHPEEAIMRLEGTPGYAINDARMDFWAEVTRLTEGENAIAYLERAASQRPDDVFAHLFLAEAYRAAGSPTEAAREYGAAGVPAKMLLDEATVYVRSGDTTGANISLDVAHLLSPSSVDTHHAAGVLHFQRGAYAEAEGSFKEALSLAPGRHDLYWWLGETYRRWGKWDEATVAYEKAATLAPDEARYHYSLAKAYRKTKRKEEAIESYEKALALNPNYQAASLELAELKHQ